MTHLELLVELLARKGLARPTRVAAMRHAHILQWHTCIAYQRRECVERVAVDGYN